MNIYDTSLHLLNKNVKHQFYLLIANNWPPRTPSDSRLLFLLLPSPVHNYNKSSFDISWLGWLLYSWFLIKEFNSSYSSHGWWQQGGQKGWNNHGGRPAQRQWRGKNPSYWFYSASFISWRCKQNVGAKSFHVNDGLVTWWNMEGAIMQQAARHGHPGYNMHYGRFLVLETLEWTTIEK